MARSILVIEDDSVIQDIITKSIASNETRLTIIANGEEALIFLSTNVPDLILVDIGLPGLNGYETISKMRAMPGLSQTPVIFLSGRSKEEDNGRSFASGGQLYLKKPFSVQELRSLVDLALGSLPVQR